MTPELIFSAASSFAALGWLVLIAGVIMHRTVLINGLAGRWWPLTLALAYSVLVVFFFAAAPGGFDSLANVKLLFTSDWAALAGWIHYLAFDLFIGAWITRRVLAENLPRLVLVPILPATFLFGPTGFVLLELSRLLFARSQAAGKA